MPIANRKYRIKHTSLLTVRSGLSGNTGTEFPVVVVKSFNRFNRICFIFFATEMAMEPKENSSKALAVLGADDKSINKARKRVLDEDTHISVSSFNVFNLCSQNIAVVPKEREYNSAK